MTKQIGSLGCDSVSFQIEDARLVIQLEAQTVVTSPDYG